MTSQNLPQPPRVDEPQFDAWLFRFWKSITESLQSSASGAATSHSSLTGLNTSQYTHLTATEADDLTDGGDSVAHYHSADRNRANHTGTQPASTISDFIAAVQAASAQSSGVLEAQVFAARQSVPYLGNASAILQGQIFGG